MLRSTAKILSIVIVLAMVLGAFAVVAPALSAPVAPAASDEAKFVDPEPMYAGDEYRNQNLDYEAMAQDLDAVNGDALAAPGNIYQNGSIARYYVGSYGKWAFNATGATGYMHFQKMAETTHCELWVGTDLTFPAGDSRNAYTSRITVNSSQAKYMATHFEKVIYPNMTDFFGAAPQIDGENSWFKAQGRPYFGTNVTGRVMIMAFNIVDESFWDSNYPSYIVGYFSPDMDVLYDRNIIHMDIWDWQNRTTASSARPWVYESTIAHEYQHLLNNFFNPEQISFVNEGCSMYAEVVCGYGIDMGYVDYFFYTPDNSLVDWGDQGGINILADYGAAALFTTWLADHFGPEMIQAMVHSEGTSGIDSVNFAFGEIGATGWDFNKAFNYWRLANLILSDTPGNGWFNYVSVDPTMSTYGGPRIYAWYPYYDSFLSAGTLFGPTGSYGGYYTGLRTLGAYGTDYIYVLADDGPAWSDDFSPDELKFVFMGDAESAKGWQMTTVPLDVGDVMYSENFNHAGAFPSGWSQQHPDLSSGGITNVVGGGPWHMESLGSGNYQAAANGPGVLLDPLTQIQYERLYSSYFDLTDVEKAQLSFDLGFQMGTGNDYCRIRVSAVSSMDASWQTYYLWSSDFDGRVVLDVSDLTGWVIQLRFDFLTYGGDSFMTVDNLAFNEVSSTVGWWSDKGDLVDYSLMTDLDLTGMETAVLTLDSSWDIEPNWDFGFVQVSTDGENWTSVASEFTTSDHDGAAMGTIVENLPGITGNSGGYVTANYDLSEWAGQMVKVRLRYMTDWGSSLGGWYIKGAELNGEAIAMDAWVSDTPGQLNQWMVTLYFPGAVGLESNVYMLPIMTTLTLDQATQIVLRHMTSFVEYPEMYILVSPTVGNADYSIGMSNFWGLPT